ncbi:MAG TPA: TipAS antibiotic-recognition domain-containing protein [Thiolinea sp.]|mgnify:CR=1 FL=1|nr:TipAS antibiotic-recognition domain-containing protein [Thiolinea sp.]
MLLKVGELAKCCGLTIRTLHHYDAIGLLTPSARSTRSYRLYNRHDIARLHQIQALRRFGLSLADIRGVLASPDSQLAAIVDKQIQVLNQQLSQMTLLRERLVHLQAQLKRGEEPELTDWLMTLEMMNMYDNYFTKEEQQQLALLPTATNPTIDEWAALVASVQALIDKNVLPQDPAAQALAKRWMEMLMRDTQGDPRLLAKLNRMHEQEPALQASTGITPDLALFVRAAFAETKYAIYQNYLNPAELAFLRANYLKRTDEFPALIAKVRNHFEAGTAPNDPRMQQLAAQWLDLFRSYAGNDPATHAKIRAANAAEPELLAGSWLDRSLLAYVIQAIAAG